jgi:hypothetical protein
MENPFDNLPEMSDEELTNIFVKKILYNYENDYGILLDKQSAAESVYRLLTIYRNSPETTSSWNSSEES